MITESCDSKETWGNVEILFNHNGTIIQVTTENIISLRLNFCQGDGYKVSLISFEGKLCLNTSKFPKGFERQTILILLKKSTSDKATLCQKKKKKNLVIIFNFTLVIFLLNDLHLQNIYRKNYFLMVVIPAVKYLHLHCKQFPATQKGSEE